MQKLLRPSSVPFLSISVTVATPFLSLPPKVANQPMSAAAAGSSLKRQLSYSRYLALSSTNTCSVCRCLSLTHSHTRNNNKTLLLLNPSRNLSLHSASEGSFITQHDPVEDAKEKKPFNFRLNRRQKGSSSSSPAPSNPDLLAIPGVGPRNFRKLVQKGIAGVAQLKQLYKDKVSLSVLFR